MPSLDIFNNDAFSLRALTGTINDAPFQPMLIGEMGIFEEEGVSTTTFMIERRGTTLTLIPSQPRGAPGRPESNDKATLIPITTVHLPQRASVKADEVQNLRAFGTESELESVQNLVNGKLTKLRRNIDVTMEWQRIGALKGIVYDADGTTVLLNTFTAFNVAQQTHAMLLTTTTTKVKLKVVEAIRKIETALGGLVYRGIVALCGAAFFDELVGHPLVIAAYDRWLDGAFLREQQRGQNNGQPGFAFAGVIWREYRGTVSGQDFIGTDEAYMFPIGVPGLFQCKFAPADWMDTVNTMGLPYYAQQEPMPMKKGIEIEAQSNPICLNTRPNTVIKLLKVS